jgi:hypothetical protein
MSLTLRFYSTLLAAVLVGGIIVWLIATGRW